MPSKSNIDTDRNNEKRTTTEATPEDWHDFWYNSEDVELRKIYKEHDEGC